MDLDTNWCPVCERLIAPERITLSPASEEVVTKSTTAPVPKPKSGTIRPMRRSTAGHSRSGSKSGAATHKPVGIDLLATQASNFATSSKLRTVISQAPSALYCSDACREKDQLSSERFQLSLETMYSGPSSASSLSSPLFVSGSESDADADLLTNESYFAQLRIHGKTPRQANGPDTNSWADRRLSGGTTTATTSSSEDIPAVSAAAKSQPASPIPSSLNARPLSSSQHGRSKSVYDGNAALYAAYPLTFHRTRSGEARSRKNSYSSLCGTSIESTHAPSKDTASKPTDIQSQTQATDVTPTQSLYDTGDVSAQGLLVRPALLRAKTERSSVSPLSPVMPVSDSAPRLYPPQYGSSLPASKFGFTPLSTPGSPTGSRNTYRQPNKDLSKPRRRSEILSQDALTEANRTKSCDQIPTQKSPFMPMYPALMTTPSITRVVRKWVLERGPDGVERLVEKEVVEEYHEERKRLFHFNTEVR